MGTKRCPIALPPADMAVWYECSTGPRRPAELAKRLGLKRRRVLYAIRDLLHLELLSVSPDGYVAHSGAPPFTPKQDESNSFFKCKHCKLLLESGSVCPTCIQRKRSDRVWRPQAIRLCKEGVSPAAISSRLNIPLWDYRKGINEDGRFELGVVSVLIQAGLLGPEWRTRQRAARGEIE